MDGMGLIMFLIIGGIAGWLGSTIMKGGGFGLIGNIVVGIVGAVIGGFCIRRTRSLCERNDWLYHNGHCWSSNTAFPRRGNQERVTRMS